MSAADRLPVLRSAEGLPRPAELVAGLVGAGLMDGLAPAGDDERTHWTQAELIHEAKARFGPGTHDWRFQCPRCLDEATAADFERVGVNPFRLSLECIGIYLGAHAARGCDWVSYHVMKGPWWVTLPSGVEVPCFRLAPAPALAPVDGE